MGTPLSLEDARRLVEGYVEHYNNVRLNRRSATSRRKPEIHAEAARKQRPAADESAEEDQSQSGPSSG